MSHKIETKTFKFTMLDSGDDGGVFTGYASVWDVVDSYGDIVKKGAFKKTIKERGKFPLLWSHNIMEVLGVVELEEDDYGLRIKRGELNLDVQRAREQRSLMKQGAVDGFSIGFETIKEEFQKDKGLRLVKEVKLWEVSLCVFPANEAARLVDVKSAEEMKPYPGEHSCRLEEPDKFEEDSFRRIEREASNGKEYSVIIGKLKESGKWREQAYRYKVEEWEEEEAREHCKEHKGKFEAAAGNKVSDKKDCNCGSFSLEEPDERVSTQEADNRGDYLIGYLLSEERARAIKLHMLWRR